MCRGILGDERSINTYKFKLDLERTDTLKTSSYELLSASRVKKQFNSINFFNSFCTATSRLSQNNVRSQERVKARNCINN